MRKNLENIVFFRGKLVNLQGMIKPVEYTINVRGRLVDLSQPKVMGILNVTPDSFYSGSRKQTEQEIAASRGGRCLHRCRCVLHTAWSYGGR